MTRPVKTQVVLTAWAPDTEYSWAFFQGQLDRIAVSNQKYGAIADNFPAKVDALESGLRCLEKYRETGNSEYLMDANNYFMFEFMHPSRPDAFFKATDSSGSAGVVLKDGAVDHNYNQEQS